MSEPQAILNETDVDTIRIVEDLVNLLISNGTILMSELPQEAQDRLALRAAERLNLPAEAVPPIPPAVSP